MFFLKKKSIYFITFHKAASSLFGHEVLNGFDNLKHLDPEKKISECSEYSFNKHDLKKHGYIYGPIRLSGTKVGKIKELYEIVDETINSKRAIFLTRDPRDIIVSAYYSFIYSHKLSKNVEMRELQTKNLSTMMNQSIDQYATGEFSHHLLRSFENMFFLYDRCKDKILLRYEDLIHSPDLFISELNNFAKVDRNTINKLYYASRPLDLPDVNSHKRSGKTGQYTHELQPDTILKLNKLFDCVLKTLKY
jgi:hypothetical protein